LEFGSRLLKASGLHLAGEITYPLEPVVLNDEAGEVHFHLIPYAEPGHVRHLLGDDEIRTHDDAMRKLTELIRLSMDPRARHVLIGHAFVTPRGEPAENTSDSERPLSVGGAEHVSAAHFAGFHYTALGHLHQAHAVGSETVRYAGSLLKYSISEEHHRKGYWMVELDAAGRATVQKRELAPRRDMRTVEGYIADIERHPVHEDFVFVRLLDEAPVLSPMERIRAVYPNALHVERRPAAQGFSGETIAVEGRSGMDDLSLFRAFYKEVKGMELPDETERLFIETMMEIQQEAGERHEADSADHERIRAV
jgi:exonuclease SbcD